MEKPHEKVWEDAEHYLATYFGDYANEGTDRELIDFLFDEEQEKLLDTILSTIASSKLGERILGKIADELAEGGPDDDPRQDR